MGDDMLIGQTEGSDLNRNVPPAENVGGVSGGVKTGPPDITKTPSFSAGVSYVGLSLYRPSFFFFAWSASYVRNISGRFGIGAKLKILLGKYYNVKKQAGCQECQQSDPGTRRPTLGDPKQEKFEVPASYIVLGPHFNDYISKYFMLTFGAGLAVSLYADTQLTEMVELLNFSLWASLRLCTEEKTICFGPEFTLIRDDLILSLPLQLAW